MLVIWVVVLLSHFVTDSIPQDMLIYISVSLFVAFIGFFGLRQGNIFMNPQNCILIEGLTGDGQQRYSKSGLKEERADEIKQQLKELMDEKRLFLDENISLPQLADLINIHPNYLSQVINERYQKNFYDFINSYRVAEFKRIVAIEKNRNKTFYALALDCGFNSKASFNNSFKKLTGITPSEFVKSL
jgi:AraC-like DNA-binding protein